MENDFHFLSYFTAEIAETAEMRQCQKPKNKMAKGIYLFEMIS